MSKLREMGDRIPPMALNALKIFASLVGIILCLYFALLGAAWIVPFIVAFILSSMMEPLVRFANKRLHMSRNIASLLAMLLVSAILLTALILVAVKAIGEARDFAIKLPGMYNDAVTFLQTWIAELDARFDFITDDTIRLFNDTVARVRGELLGLVNTITRGVWATAVSVPRMIVTLVVTLLATYFLTRDRRVISRALHRHLPESWIRRSTSVRDDLFSALFGYVRAMLILMVVTFVELLIGFSLLQMHYAILFALIISILDALPVLGTGTFVVPWAVYHFFIGEFHTGIGLLTIFCVVWVVRQLLEPHVVGDQIGIHPLLTLLSMYIGMQAIGVVGMIAGPVLLIVLRNLFGVVTGGKTLREMLYAGIDMPEEELQKSIRLAAEADAIRPTMTERVTRALGNAWRQLTGKRRD